MTLPYGAFEVGGVVQPVALDGGAGLLRDSDPALYFALDFWTWVVNNYPGPRIVQAAQAAGLTTPGGQAVTAAVQQAYPYDPSSYELESQFRFPFLAAYRTRARSTRLTASYEDDRTEFQLLYVLPPLDAAAAERLLPALTSVYKALRHATTQGWDPGYTPPGGTLGGQPWSAAFANLEEIGLTGCTHGRLPSGGGLDFPSILVDGYFVERDNYVKTGGTYGGADLTVDLVADDGTYVGPIAQVSTELAPTITSLSVASGPVAGGTAVTITGTGFVDGSFSPGQLGVYFGPRLAGSIVWVSATSITCTTPAVLGPGTVGCTVINKDGQSANLPAAFTFS